MDYVNLLGNVAFPIVMCIMLFKYLNEEREEHKKETEQLRNILEENTRILSQLKSAIEEWSK